jgi:hypothetical protein
MTCGILIIYICMGIKEKSFGDSTGQLAGLA